jgi:diguanylate cyclase (GGDEF)-like protein/PAS domain S-box-containing protein
LSIKQLVRVDRLIAGAFADTSIQVKLWLLIVLNSSMALFLAGSTLLAVQLYQQREAVIRRLTAEADVVARSSTGALSFADQRAATEALAAMQADSSMVEAAIYDIGGRIFAHYGYPGAAGSGTPPARPGVSGVHFEGDFSVVFLPITLGNDRLGTVFLRTSMADDRASTRRYIGIVCAVLLVSLGLALLLSSRMRRSITEPIQELSKVASQVSREEDYSARAVKRTNGEIGDLTDSFNGMLSRIEAHDLARRAAEESLRESEERYALAARGANDGLWDWKLDTNEIYFSLRWRQMLGYSDGDLRSTPEDWFSRIHPADQDRVTAEMGEHQAGLTSEFVSEYRMRHRDGTFIWMLSRGIAVRDAEGNAIRMAGSQTDITEGKIADPLTGLPNRLFFLDRVERGLAVLERQPGLLAVLFLDLDKFKLVNDSLGHAAGDALLMEVAQRMRISLGCTDASPKDRIRVVARLGGDEFGVFLGGLRSPEDATTAAQKLLCDIGAPFYIDGRKMFAGVSIGIALSSSGRTPEDLLRNADTAMYHAKMRGRSRFDLFDDGMRERAIARLEIETELRKAIEEQQLVLYYQPQVSLAERRVTGYEALVRWKHPERGIIPPSEFVPVAEETELIIPLGRWVLEEACRQMAEWQRKFSHGAPLTISVNVSFRQLLDAGLVEDVRRVLAETGLAPGSLRLEMTESTVMTRTPEAIDSLRQLKELNIGLEIDDFGTGYSSLSYLAQLPFDTLKIDRSFVKDLGARGENSDIVRTILDLARSMSLNVVAEGVETADQAAVLTALGCSDAQGYYFSRPADATATEAAILERSAGVEHAAAAMPAHRAGPFEPSFVRAVTEADGIPLEKVSS